MNDEQIKNILLESGFSPKTTFSSWFVRGDNQINVSILRDIFSIYEKSKDGWKNDKDGKRF